MSVVLDDDVANVDADAIDDPFLFGDVGVMRADQVLDLDGTQDRLNRRGELDQKAIAHQLDDAPLTFSDLRCDQLFAMGFERGQDARLILPNEAAVADHVGGQYGGEAAFHRYAPFPGV